MNYARQMYSEHQSNYIIYVDCATMEKLDGYDAYTSHSFDQRIISLSDGGYLAVNHGDAHDRGFCLSKINSNRGYEGEIVGFHFREGRDRAYGYNETYAQLGGVLETEHAYVFCGSSERTLSVETAPTNKNFCGHSEARDLFIQIYKKDFYEYDGADQYLVNGVTRKAVGIKPEETLTELYLSGEEEDYGIRWLTEYEGTHYVSSPKIVNISNNQFVIMWEKRDYTSHNVEGTYYAVLDEYGNIVVSPLQMPFTTLTANIDPVYHEGKVYWTVSSNDGDYIYSLDPLAAPKEWIHVTGLQADSELIVEQGKTIQLQAAVVPENATVQKVFFYSYKDWIASVDEEGFVTGEEVGETTVAISSAEGNQTAICKVKVVESISELSFETEDIYLFKWQCGQVKLHINPPIILYNNWDALKWKNSNEKVATSGAAYNEWEDYYYVNVFAQEVGVTTITVQTVYGTDLKDKLKVHVLGERFAEYEGYHFYTDDKGETRCVDSKYQPVINEFKCDGTYTYYFQADGTAMKNRLTYHPDGVHVIYFDEYGHEVFSDFANVKKTIAGDDVDDYCFFDVYGYLYVDVVTYDKEGICLYYANPYGVLERGKWFEFSETVTWPDGTPFDKAGGKYGCANENGTLVTNQWMYDWEGRECYLQGNGVAIYE